MDLVPLKKNSLTRAQFEQLADIPLEEEWLANITNLKTRRAYKEDVREFVAFTALQDYMGLRSAARSHIIAWRKDMERRGLAPATIRRTHSGRLASRIFSRTTALWKPLSELPGTPTAGLRNSMTAAARRFYSRIWRGFDINCGILEPAVRRTGNSDLFVT
jgi:hypothetical protein